MPRRKSLLTVIRDMVREQVHEAVQGLLGAVGEPKRKAKNGRDARHSAFACCGGAGVEDRERPPKQAKAE